MAQMWPNLIAKAKDGGLDVIQTYVFWNLHEPTKGIVRSIYVTNANAIVTVFFVTYLMYTFQFFIISHEMKDFFNHLHLIDGNERNPFCFAV